MLGIVSVMWRHGYGAIARMLQLHCTDMADIMFCHTTHSMWRLMAIVLEEVDPWEVVERLLKATWNEFNNLINVHGGEFTVRILRHISFLDASSNSPISETKSIIESFPFRKTPSAAAALTCLARVLACACLRVP